MSTTGRQLEVTRSLGNEAHRLAIVAILLVVTLAAGILVGRSTATRVETRQVAPAVADTRWTSDAPAYRVGEMSVMNHVLGNEHRTWLADSRIHRG